MNVIDLFQNNSLDGLILRHEKSLSGINAVKKFISAS